MIRRLARPYAVVGWLTTLGGAVGAITLRIVDPVPVVPSTFGFSDTALLGFEFLGVTFASVGSLLVVRRPGNAVGWCMVLIGAASALSGLAAAVTFSAVADGPAAATTASFAAWLTVLFTTIRGLVFFLGLIFPTGRGHTAAWDRLIVVSAINVPWLVVLVFLIRPGPLYTFPTIDNPYGVGPDLRLVFGPQVSSLIGAFLVFFVAVIAWSIVSRYRRSDAIGRRQLKWFILALLVALGALALTLVGAVISDQPPEAGLPLFGFAGALVPIAIGIAILRHGLYDIDRIISRTISWAAVTGTLAAVFAGAVISLQAALAGFTQGQTVAVAASTLVAFALFQPIRRRVQAAVDRRFNRARYDGERTAAAFADRLRDQVDLPMLAADLDATVRLAIAPSRVGLWLRRNAR
jgi:hypothetical protein